MGTVINDFFSPGSIQLFFCSHSLILLVPAVIDSSRGGDVAVSVF